MDDWFEIDIDHIGASEDMDMDIVENGDDMFGTTPIGFNVISCPVLLWSWKY